MKTALALMSKISGFEDLMPMYKLGKQVQSKTEKKNWF